MADKRKLKVFLCHSSGDKPKVHELYKHMVTEGFDVWLDEERLLPGQDWDLEIRKAVRESDVVVVCLSDSSATKAGYVQKEIRFALDVADEQPEGAIYLIPARLEDCQVPNRLTKWHWVNLFETNGLHKLELSLKARANELGMPLSTLLWENTTTIVVSVVSPYVATFGTGANTTEVTKLEKSVSAGISKLWEWILQSVETKGREQDKQLLNDFQHAPAMYQNKLKRTLLTLVPEEDFVLHKLIQNFIQDLFELLSNPDYFRLGDLKRICSCLDVSWEDEIASPTREALARWVITFARTRQKEHELIEAMIKTNPMLFQYYS
jgi:hypothetical protein